MNADLIELKKVERDFRNLSNQLFKTEFNDGNIYLKKFNNYIRENSIIYEIIKEFDNSDVDLNNFICKETGIKLTIPEDEKLHYQYILKYILWLINNEVNLGAEFVWYKRKTNYTECIQSALNDIVNPLYSYIRRELINKIDILDSSIKEEQALSIYNIENQHNGNNIGIQDNSTNKVGGDILQGNNKISTKVKFYQKEGFWSGVLSGIIVGLAVWGIEELIKFLITL